METYQILKFFALCNKKNSFECLLMKKGLETLEVEVSKLGVTNSYAYRHEFSDLAFVSKGYFHDEVVYHHTITNYTN